MKVLENVLQHRKQLPNKPQSSPTKKIRNPKKRNLSNRTGTPTESLASSLASNPSPGPMSPMKTRAMTLQAQSSGGSSMYQPTPIHLLTFFFFFLPSSEPPFLLCLFASSIESVSVHA
jgi:hypothetical protein